MVVICLTRRLGFFLGHRRRHRCQSGFLGSIFSLLFFRVHVLQIPVHGIVMFHKSPINGCGSRFHVVHDASASDAHSAVLFVDIDLQRKGALLAAMAGNQFFQRGRQVANELVTTILLPVVKIDKNVVVVFALLRLRVVGAGGGVLVVAVAVGRRFHADPGHLYFCQGNVQESKARIQVIEPHFGSRHELVAGIEDFAKHVARAQTMFDTVQDERFAIHLLMTKNTVDIGHIFSRQAQFQKVNLLFLFGWWWCRRRLLNGRCNLWCFLFQHLARLLLYCNFPDLFLCFVDDNGCHGDFNLQSTLGIFRRVGRNVHPLGRIHGGSTINRNLQHPHGVGIG
mmetsp:Transcript_15070/g.32921  ORF Transcript_15070/g.32921 Transcript_15070/m.32921 type:complete len:339 (+) Transcript_15070:859-1875(+)